MPTSILDTPILDRMINADPSLQIAFATIQANTSFEAMVYLKSMIEANLHSGEDGLFETPKYPYLEDVRGTKVPRELPEYIPGDIDFAIGMLTRDVDIIRAVALSMDQQFITFPNVWVGGIVFRSQEVHKELGTKS